MRSLSGLVIQDSEIMSGRPYSPAHGYASRVCGPSRSRRQPGQVPRFLPLGVPPTGQGGARACRRTAHRPCTFCSMSRSRVSVLGSWKALRCRPCHGRAGQASATASCSAGLRPSSMCSSPLTRTSNTSKTSAGFPVAVAVLVVHDNRIETLEPLAPLLLSVLPSLQAGRELHATRGARDGATGGGHRSPGVIPRDVPVSGAKLRSRTATGPRVHGSTGSTGSTGRRC